jgi:adenine deaminase
MNAKELAAPGAVVPGTVSEMVPDTTASPGTPGAVSEMVPDTKNRTQAIVEAFKKARPRFPLEGHCPKISGPDLSAFIAAGVWSDHTQQTPASLLEKIGKGMFIEMQKKSLSKENIETIIEHRLFEHIALVTDDVMPDELEKGHLNLLVKKAIELGMRPEDAIYSAAYSPSRHMMLRDRGAIAPGRIADFILLTDLHSFEIAGVYKRGRLVDASARNVLKKQAPASNGGAENSLYKNRSFPPHFYTSIRRRCLDADGLTPPLPPDFQGSSIGCVTIRPDKASTFTGRGHIDCAVRDGKLCWQEQGLSLIAVVERYGHEAPVSFGLVEWNLLPKGAIASSWAHDHHNILVMGTDEKAMAQAVNRIIAIQGGLVVVQNGQIAAEAPLPVGGIVSDEPLPALAAAIRQVRKAMVNLGYKRGDEIMSFGTLSLLVSPELKISDRGLVDVKHQELVNLYETPQQ